MRARLDKPAACRHRGGGTCRHWCRARPVSTSAEPHIDQIRGAGRFGRGGSAAGKVRSSCPCGIDRRLGQASATCSLLSITAQSADFEFIRGDVCMQHAYVAPHAGGTRALALPHIPQTRVRSSRRPAPTALRRQAAPAVRQSSPAIDALIGAGRVGDRDRRRCRIEPGGKRIGDRGRAASASACRRRSSPPGRRGLPSRYRPAVCRRGRGR